MMVRRLVLLYLCVSSFTLVRGFAQNSAPAGTGDVSFVVLVDSTDQSREYADLVQERVRLGMMELGLMHVDDPGSAMLELVLRIRPVAPRLHVALSIMETSSGSLIGGSNVRARTNLTLLRSVDELILAVEPRIRAYQLARAAGADPYRNAEQATQLVIVGSQDEVEVELLGYGSIGIIREGSLTHEGSPIAVGSTVQLEFRHRAHYAERRTYRIESTRPRLEAPRLVRHTRQSFQLHYRVGRLFGLGVGYRFYPLPDTIYVHTDIEIFSEGLLSAPYPPVILDVRTSIGTYVLGAPTSPVRISMHTGAGAILTIPTSGGVVPFIDAYLNLIGVDMEANIGRWSPFVHVGAHWAFQSVRGLLRPGLNNPAFAPALNAGVRLRL